MKRLTKEQWRERRVFNPHNLAKSGGGLMLYIEYSPYERGRAAQTAHWAVIRVGYKTDPDGHWRDDGDKVFYLWNGSERQQRLDEAKAWCAERYGVTEWERSPFGSWHPLGTMQAAFDATEPQEAKHD